MSEADRIFSVSLRPRRRLVVSMHPYLKIPKNPDGTGGGIRLRISGNGEFQMLDVVWGESTEVEIDLPEERS